MKHFIFDTETTALIQNSAQPLHKQPHVIEFFGILWNEDNGDEEIFSWLINPGKPLPKKVTEITTITDAMVKDAPSFRSVSDEIVAAIERGHRIVAHNLKYDQQVIDFELKRCNKWVHWSHGICTVEATEHFKGHRLKLADLHMHLFGEGFSGAHRAEHDVRALLRCYKKLIEMGEI